MFQILQILLGSILIVAGLICIAEPQLIPRAIRSKKAGAGIFSGATLLIIGVFLIVARIY